MSDQFDINKPFTTKEYLESVGMIQHIQNPSVTRKAAEHLKAAGFTKKYHQRAYKWSRDWPKAVGVEFPPL